MKKAALYIRVSTSHQVDKDSLPLQRKDLENYAKYALNIEETVVFEDAGYSAKNTKRPKYQEMMQRIKEGEFTHLIVWKIDRISRNLKDFTVMYEELKDYGVTFVSKNEQFDTSTPIGEAVLKIILVFAELERQLSSERVTAVMLDRAQQGIWNGGAVPIGYAKNSDNSFPVVDVNTVAIVKDIFNLYESVKSTRIVSQKLREENISTQFGGEWQAKTVRDVLRNEFYIGTYKYKDIKIENNHPAIIDKEQFLRVNKLLDDNYRGLTDVKRANIHTHIFSKMIYCGKCNMLLSSGLDGPRKNGYRPSRYICMNLNVAKSCDNYVSDMVVAPFIFNYVSNLIRLQHRITANHSIRDIERALLRGNPFLDVVGIDTTALKDTYRILTRGRNDYEYTVTKQSDKVVTNLEVERLTRERKKYETSLKRLKNLYLFDENDMSETEYVLQKREIINFLEKIDDKLYELNKNNENISEVFVDNAQHFLITKEMEQVRFINYRELEDTVGREVMADFVREIISRIVVIDKRIHSITFKNGITHTFAYKALLDSKAPAPAHMQYREYKEAVLEYLKENGSATRSELQKATNITIGSIYILLKELITSEQIIKTGQSTLTRYHYNHEKTT
ncbi:recombinase family protein [Metasolibacillus sp.]|uniref:recombinase family protein n=1 Tax=Metasolibacillus sp. TaxID=2703680 RepID=UPI0025DC4DF7|nr:recombinase family protein [Metasolibacillus sp.]MCT6922771.1 recombinase family protein [Metasolibacillus sp.]MCT6938890.1 recombinase family protein [Metasolibacillus sp.]